MRTNPVIEKIVDEIMQYESDTFSAEASEVHRPEAREMAAEMIKDRVTDEVGYAIDGLMLSEWLEKVRFGE